MRLICKNQVPRPRKMDHFLFGDLLALRRPIVIEIGCGVGFHPLTYAEQNPHHLMIAIEQTETRFEKFERRVSRNKHQGNLFPVHANAVHWIVHNVPPESVGAYYILYPNPNWKHKNRQWHQMPFTRELINTLRPLGTLTFATNELEYFEDAYHAFRDVWGLIPLESGQIPMDAKGRTHFEIKFLRLGVPCYNFVFQKSLERKGIGPSQSVLRDPL